MSDTRAERGPSGAVELIGTYSPGQHDVGYQFQLTISTTRAGRFA